MIMKKIILGILIILCISLSGCAYHGANQDSPTDIKIIDGEESNFIMKIDDTVVDITWENNDILLLCKKEIILWKLRKN